MILNTYKTAPSTCILIIDDELSILTMISVLLTRHGYAVDTAESGEEGIKKIDTNNYNLILTDLRMPGISGEQILSYLRDEKKSSTPVVGMSGTPWLLEPYDFDAIISKPSSTKEILATIQRALNKETHKIDQTLPYSFRPKINPERINCSCMKTLNTLV